MSEKIIKSPLIFTSMFIKNAEFFPSKLFEMIH